MSVQKGNEIYIDVPAELKKNGIGTKADGTLDLTFNTQENNAAEAAAVMGMRGKFGRLVFVAREDPLSDEELDGIQVPEAPKEKEMKTPGQRLRAVLYRRWETEGAQRSFEVYYAAKMEGLINEQKEYLT